MPLQNGSPVGARVVGWDVGESVGASEGACVGVEVGRTVGTSDGVDVGGIVGEPVQQPHVTAHILHSTRFEQFIPDPGSTQLPGSLSPVCSQYRGFCEGALVGASVGALHTPQVAGQSSDCCWLSRHRARKLVGSESNKSMQSCKSQSPSHSFCAEHVSGRVLFVWP